MGLDHTIIIAMTTVYITCISREVAAVAKQFSSDCNAPSWYSGDLENSSRRDVITYPGEVLTLKCRSHAHPSPTVTWYKDGESLNQKTIRDAREKTCIECLQYPIMKHKSITIMVSNMTTGIYTCKVKNHCGHLQRDFFVSVKTKLSMPGELSYVAIDHTKEFTEGKRAYIKCRIPPSQHVKVEWMKFSLKPNEAASIMSYWRRVRTGGRIKLLRGRSVSGQSDSSESLTEEEGSDMTLSGNGDSQEQEEGGIAREEKDNAYSNNYEYYFQKEPKFSTFDVDSDEFGDSSLSSEETGDITNVILFFSKVRRSDRGIYTCLVDISSDKYSSRHIYNMTSYILITEKVNKRVSIDEKPRISESHISKFGEGEDNEKYLRGIFIAVVVSCVIVVGGITSLCVTAILKATKRQDVILGVYDLRD